MLAVAHERERERARVGGVGERWAFNGPAECKFFSQVVDRRM
jgi:hypothetical protein